ncbi:hypothetical protein THARTR1_02501 [Trichoderma harzianum]|uniref:Uncharacterized protein n=1 Tax=Trichoderma harzianum TaxID=5544 RepID=A0A2K0UIA0_TRIHA|nr:hypothetical protein THARTR1_02501 [Trichoderma harzianum]
MKSLYSLVAIGLTLMQVCRASDDALNQDSTTIEIKSQFEPKFEPEVEPRQSLQNNICNSESASPMCASTCQKPPLHDCDFYKQCVEASVPCDGSTHSYALDWGHKICNKFIGNLDRFSPRGQKFLTGAINCLQRNLVPVVSSRDATCKSISDAAFASHAPCYVENGFCGLECKDYMALTTLLAENLFKKGAIGVMYHSTSGCIMNIEEVIEEGACVSNALKGFVAAIARTSSN